MSIDHGQSGIRMVVPKSARQSLFSGCYVQAPLIGVFQYFNIPVLNWSILKNARVCTLEKAQPKDIILAMISKGEKYA